MPTQVVASGNRAAPSALYPKKLTDQFAEYLMKPQRCFHRVFCYQVEAAYAGVDENEEATDKSVETDESS